MNVSGKRALLAFVSIVSVAAIIGSLIPSHRAFAAGITSRSLTLESTGNVANDLNGDGIPDGGSMPGATVNHLFTFKLPTTGTVVHSISFQYCTTADVDTGGACTKPLGLTTTGATLGTETVDGLGFDTLHAGTDGDPYLSSTAGLTPTDASSTIELDDIVNQNATNCGGSDNCTFFVRITTYTSTDATTGATDAGTVAASTSTQIVLTGTMPESLIFCTGATVNATCTTTTSGNITFTQLFSPTATVSATSQLAASTNAEQGYVITVNGPTMSSGGSNHITAIGATPAASTPGTRQFGMNLAANTGAYSGGGDPVVTNSAYVSPAATGGDYMGSATQNFNTGDPNIDGSTDQQSKFAFDDTAPNIIAKSDNAANQGFPGGLTPGPTDSQVYTASYIVNVSGNLPAGSYTTTLTYICTPTF